MTWKNCYSQRTVIQQKFFNALFFFSLYSAATRKKLFEIAKSFSEKTRRRKTKKRALLKHRSYPPATSGLMSHSQRAFS